MQFIHRLYRPMTILALLLGLQSCNTILFDVVLPKLDRGNGWSVDASDHLVYQESIIGSRLSILIRPDLRSDPPKPLRINMVFSNNFDAIFSLDPRQLVLKIDSQRYTASLESCSSPVGNIPATNLGVRIVTLQELSRYPMKPCLVLLFDVQQPDDWTKVTLHINGLFKNDQKLMIPEIGFYKTKRKAPGSFM